MSDRQSAMVRDFRALHESGCFLMPNPWDTGSAIYLAHLGFKALATTSAGMAFARGLPDSISAITCEIAIDHVREISAATPLPLNVDFQHGYAREPEGVATNVVRCVRSGAAGLSIEDSTGDTRAPLFERALAIERIRAARAAIDATGVPVVLTARCESWLVGDSEPARTALDRLLAYADAGADCLYAPGVADRETIGAIVRAVAPRPVNVLMSSAGPFSVRVLADLGVRRISVGSALARVAWGAFMRAAKALAETGESDVLADAANFEALNALFDQPA